MKAIGVEFLRAKNKDINNGQDLVVQTIGLQLVGTVRTFSKDARGEEGRRMYLESKTDPHFFAKANGYRVYISLHSSLEGLSQRFVNENKELIHECLQDMAQFYAENMTEGMRRHFAED